MVQHNLAVPFGILNLAGLHVWFCCDSLLVQLFTGVCAKHVIQDIIHIIYTEDIRWLTICCVSYHTHHLQKGK